MAVFIANSLLITLYPKKTKGMFTSNNSKGREMPVTSEESSAIPVAPPSIKLLGRRNPSKPNAADPMPFAPHL